MALTLAQYQSRIAAYLMDASNAIWPTATLDECLQLALDDYSDANPGGAETVVTVSVTGREVALDGVTGFLQASDVWWPYSSTGSEKWPPNRVKGFRVYWDDDQPVLFLESIDGGQPQSGDELRLWYSKARTVQDLGGAAATTVQALHESWLVMGAAGYAAFARATDLAETAGVSSVSTPNLAALGSRWLRTFRRNLGALRGQSNPGGPSQPVFSGEWKLDKWDNGGWD